MPTEEHSKERITEKNGGPIPNESFEKYSAVIGDKDDTEDKEKLNQEKTKTEKADKKEIEKKEK